MLLQAGRAQYARLEDALKGVGLSAAKYYVLSQLANAQEPIPLRLLAEEQEMCRIEHDDTHRPARG